MKKRNICIITMLFVFTIIACGKEFKDREPTKIKDPLSKHKTVIIKTSKGDITIKLHWDAAPLTCLNFAKLAKKGYYKNVIFHRVISNFMIQTGDPTGTGRGGKSYLGKAFQDEINADALGLDKIKVGKSRMYWREQRMAASKVLKGSSRKEMTDYINKTSTWTVKKLYQTIGYRYTKKLKTRKALRGSLAMANAGPDTNGSQFFINIINTPWLDGKHTVFGSVVKGLKIADKISNVKTKPGDKPVKEIKILDIILK